MGVIEFPPGVNAGWLGEVLRGDGSILENAVHLLAGVAAATSQPTRLSRTAMQLALRRLIDSFVDSYEEGMNDTEESISHLLFPLLDLTVQLAKRGSTDPLTPYLVLEDWFERSTVKESDALFDTTEKAVHLLTDESLFTPSARLNLMRICNKLLTRLSKTHDTGLRGRVLLFLARVLTLDDRSGLNVKQEFDTTNETVLDASVEDGAAEVGFYRTLWGLQTFFADPLSAFKLGFDDFSERIDQVLSAFERNPITSSDIDLQRKIQAEFGDEDWYAPKYLTGSKLLPLQLRDPSLHVHILLQTLILCQYMRLNAKKVPLAITSEDKVRVEQLEKRVKNQLQRMPPNGAVLVNDFLFHLQREERWFVWKDGMCSEAIELQPTRKDSKIVPPAPPATKMPRGRRVGVDISAAAVPILMGKIELNRLWRISEAAGSVPPEKSDARVFEPDLQTKFINVLVDDEDPEASIEDEYKNRNDERFTWKCLRLLSRKNIHLFSESEGNLLNLISKKAGLLSGAAGEAERNSEGNPHNENAGDIESPPNQGATPREIFSEAAAQKMSDEEDATAPDEAVVKVDDQPSKEEPTRKRVKIRR